MIENIKEIFINSPELFASTILSRCGDLIEKAESEFSKKLTKNLVEKSQQN